MRIIFIGRRGLINLSLLAVIICLLGAMKLVGGNATVAQWVNAGLAAGQAPLLLAGDPQNQAVSLLVQLDADCDPAALGQMLKLLAANSAKATFFVSGQLAENQPELLKSILAGGHQLGNFGYDNTSPANLTLAENRAALEKTSALIAKACGQRPDVYMPPYGVTEEDIRQAAAEAGLLFVLGGVDAGDWREEAAPEDIIAAVLAQAGPGSFISLNLNQGTLAALDTMLKELSAQGLAFYTVAQNLTAPIETISIEDAQGEGAPTEAPQEEAALGKSPDNLEPPDNLAAAAGENLQISARGALLLDMETGQVLWQQNGEEPLPPASTTKILTALLCLDLAPLQREVTVSPEAAAVGESSAGLLPGERFQLGELLNAALLKSANDACYAIAEGVVGSEPFFVHLMNVKAAAAGAGTASLYNTNGLPAEGHLLSCRDLALLTRAAMQHEEFRQRVGSQYGVMQGGSYNRSLKNTNKLLAQNQYVTGVKTGTTNAAGACLVSSMEREGRSVIAVVLHSGDRYNDSLRLLNYGIEGFHNVELVQAGQRLAFYPVADSLGGGVWLLAEQSLAVTLPAGVQGQDIAAVYHLRPAAAGELRASAGALLGTLEFQDPAGECLGRVNLLAEADVVYAPWRRGLWRVEEQMCRVWQILFA